ncbi:uncharacterized protein LOC111707850 [Eurytemora carolleeae]|uniref:uncharacterized protein LOC111707850 n=1 Tax=Eurytemora carolleeae TaxID=1294199 RepID=UPI000C77C6E2|nr:uncharacterized protein LOC111707850 [Eurytemora carolleeae]|eukprot:XP_023336796.1 uncharacterized protein LOC111707850 [Eurytemora affinis]
MFQWDGRRYSEGDTLNVNCTAEDTKPPVNLTWYINSTPVGEPMLIRYPVWNLTRNQDMLHSSVLGLRYKIHRRDFVDDNSRIKLKCVASMYNVYYKANEISAERSADQQYTTHSYRNRAGDLTTLDPYNDASVKFSSFLSSGTSEPWSFYLQHLLCFSIIQNII